MSKQDNATKGTATTATASGDNAALPAIGYNTKFNFKSYKLGSDNATALQGLVKAGKLKDDDIQQIKDEDGKETIAIKRKSHECTLTVPDMVKLLRPEVPAAIAAHIQHLVNKRVEDGNKELVDAGDAPNRSWLEILSEEPAVRKAAPKVTKEKVEAATAALVAQLTELGVKEAGRQLTENLCNAKFSVAACRKIPAEVLEHIQGYVVDWYSELDEVAQAEHAPVVEVWASAIDKILKPAEDISVDMF